MAEQPAIATLERPTQADVHARIKAVLDGQWRWFRLETEERKSVLGKMNTDFAAGRSAVSEYFPFGIQALSNANDAADGAGAVIDTVFSLLDTAYRSAFTQVTEEQIDQAAAAAAVAYEKAANDPLSGVQRFFSAAYAWAVSGFSSEAFNQAWDIYPVESVANAVYGAVYQATNSAAMAEIVSGIGPDRKLIPGAVPAYYQSKDGTPIQYTDVQRISTYNERVQEVRAEEPNRAQAVWDDMEKRPYAYIVGGLGAYTIGRFTGVNVLIKSALEIGIRQTVDRPVKLVMAAATEVNRGAVQLGRGMAERRLAARAYTPADPSGSRLRAFNSNTAKINAAMDGKLAQRIGSLSRPGFWKWVWRGGTVVPVASAVWALADGIINTAGAASNSDVTEEDLAKITETHLQRVGSQAFDLVPWAGTAAGLAAEDLAVLSCKETVAPVAKDYCGIAISSALGITTEMIRRVESQSYRFERVQGWMNDGNMQHPFIQAWLAEMKRQFPDKGNDAAYFKIMREHLTAEMNRGSGTVWFYMYGPSSGWTASTHSITISHLTNEQMRVDLLNQGPIYMRLMRDMMVKGMSREQMSQTMRDMFEAIQAEENEGRGDKIFRATVAPFKDQYMQGPTDDEWAHYEETYYAMESLPSAITASYNYLEGVKSFADPDTEGASRITLGAMANYNRHFREWFLQQPNPGFDPNKPEGPNNRRTYTKEVLKTFTFIATGEAEIEREGTNGQVFAPSAFGKHPDDIWQEYFKHIRGDGRDGYLERTMSQMEQAAQSMEDVLPFLENPGQAAKLFALAYSLPDGVAEDADPKLADLIDHAGRVRELSRKLFKDGQEGISADQLPSDDWVKLTTSLARLQTSLGAVPSTYVEQEHIAPSANVGAEADSSLQEGGQLEPSLIGVATGELTEVQHSGDRTYTIEQMRKLLKRAKETNDYGDPAIQEWLKIRKEAFPVFGNDEAHFEEMHRYMGQWFWGGRFEAPGKTEERSGFMGITSKVTSMHPVSGRPMTFEEMRKDLQSQGPIYMRLLGNMMAEGMSRDEMEAAIKQMYDAAVAAKSNGRAGEAFVMADGPFKDLLMSSPSPDEITRYTTAYGMAQGVPKLYEDVPKYREAVKNFVAAGATEISNASAFDMARYNQHFREWFLQQEGAGTEQADRQEDLKDFVERARKNARHSNPMGGKDSETWTRYLAYINGEGSEAYAANNRAQAKAATSTFEAMEALRDPQKFLELLLLAQGLPSDQATTDPAASKVMEYATQVRNIVEGLFPDGKLPRRFSRSFSSDPKFGELLKQLIGMEVELGNVSSTYQQQSILSKRRDDEQVEAVLAELQAAAQTAMAGLHTQITYGRNIPGGVVTGYELKAVALSGGAGEIPESRPRGEQHMVG